MIKLVYLGSKNRLSKEIAPIIQSYINDNTTGYLEPFVGGANMIDKIDCDNKIGCDIHKELIALLNKAKYNVDEIPNCISKEVYDNVKNNKDLYEDWYVGLVGFCCSFSGKYFQGYARANDNRNRQEEMIRNLKSQAKKFTDITFKHCNYLDLPKDEIKGYVIYCDAPYNVNTKYTHTNKFDHDKYYEWLIEMSKYNTVLVSEYNMPDCFECIWEKKVKVSFNGNKNSKNENKNRVEKLFMYKTK